MLENLRTVQEGLQKNIEILTEEKTKLQEAVTQLQKEDPDLLVQKVRFHDEFQERFSYIRQNHPDVAERLKEDIMQMNDLFDCSPAQNIERKSP